MPTPTSEQFDANWINGLLPGFRRMGFGQSLNQVQADLVANAEAADSLAQAAIAMSSFPYTELPTDTQTVTIGADVYEFCTALGATANTTNIGVVIGDTARATYDNLVAAINATDGDNAHATLVDSAADPCPANGTENVLAVAVNGGDTASGTIYLYAADAPGGSKVEGAGPDIALTDTATNGGPWRKLNLNLSVGAGFEAATQAFHGKHAIVAADLADSQPVLVPLPFAAQSWLLQVRDAAGVAKPDAYAAVTVPAAVGDQNFLGINLAPTAPTTLKRQIITIPVTASASQFAHWNPPAGVVPTGYKFVRGGAAPGTCTVAIDRITKSTGAVQAALSTAVNVAAGTDDVEQTLTPSVAISGTNHALATTQGLKFTVAAGAGASPPPITVIVEYYEPAIATDVIHLSVFGA